LLLSGLLITGMGALPDLSLAQQPTAQNKDKAPAKKPAQKAEGRLKLCATLKGHSGNVHCVTFSPDGKLLASGSEDSTVKIWDTASGKEVRTLAGHEDIIWSLAFSPDGKSLASTSFNYKDPGKTPDSVKIWKVGTWEEQVQLKDNKGGFKFCTFSPDGKVLAAASAYQNLAKTWDTATGKMLGAIVEDRRFGISSLLFSLDGKTLIVGGTPAAGEDPIRLWNWAECKPNGTLKSEGRGCDVVRFSRDGKTLLTCNELGEITFWDFEMAQARKTVHVPVSIKIDYSLVLSPAANMVAERTAWADIKDGVRLQRGKVLLRDMATGQLFESIPVDGCQFTHRSMAFSPGGRLLAIGAFDNEEQAGIVRIWEVRGPASERKKK
jgi:WD40 repeat protein